MAPLAALTVHFAEHVVQQHVRRSRLIRAREIADDGIETECGLDRIGLEPVVEQIAGALREQIEQIAPTAQIERTKTPAHFPCVEERAEIPARPRAEVRRCPSQQVAKQFRRAIEHRVVVRKPLGVAR